MHKLYSINFTALNDVPFRVKFVALLKNRSASCFCLFLFAFLLTGMHSVWAQSNGSNNPGQPTTLYNTPQRDTSQNKSNTGKWRDGETRITIKQLNSDIAYTPDTALHTFQRRPFTEPWYRDLGNLGSPSQNLFFTPEDRFGPTLGYHVFDVYRFHVDSLRYFNTTHPYTEFTYQLGSKLEQMASIMHTQNIKPNWNFAFEYRKINSPGFYKIQRTNDDNLWLTTNYKSKDLHYQVYAAFVYNKQQQDENGGITRGGELSDGKHGDKRTVDVAFQKDFYSLTRSSVSNTQRDFTFLLQHQYSWGHADTLYNEDSTHYTAVLVPRFRITHKMELSTEKFQYKDVYPDSATYTALFQHGFTGGLGIDSVFMQQKWLWVDNRVLLNGFFGPLGKQLEFNAGVGNRYDAFLTTYATGFSRNNFISNYAVGEIKKEALKDGQWFYQANAQLFLTGDAAGDFTLNAFAGRSLKNNWGMLSAGFRQQLNSAPYNYTIYKNQYYSETKSYTRETVTQLYATLSIPRIKLSGGIKEHIIDNYIFLNNAGHFDQDVTPFSVSQLWLRKVFTAGIFVLDNELTYQQPTGNAPVNVPNLMGRHQLSVEAYLFKKALKIATGVEVRYHTPYHAAGYDPFYNRFFYQGSYQLTNNPEGSLFFNFRIKRFRAYIMGDQLQALFLPNNMAAPGYPLQDAMIRFGFSWVMIN